MRVKSIVDARSKLFVFTVIGIMSALAAYMTRTLMLTVEEALLGYLAVCLTSGLLLWLLYGTYYELRSDCLVCRSGPFVEQIPYDSILALDMSENTLSCLALSTRRIEILWHDDGYVTGTTMISPRGRELFMARLRQRCIHLQRIA